MSSDNPPYPYYNGIPFNPSFFTSNTTNLSEATANNLYLRKTVPDTATAQETFTSGIITQGNSTIGVVGSGTLTVNRPIAIGYDPSAITASSMIGFSIKYDFLTNTAIAPNSSYTVASFTDTPVGIYLLAVGPFVVFSFNTTDRFDMINATTTNITFLSGSSAMEFGGNNLQKIGVCYSTPIKITNNTNSLIVQIKNDVISPSNISVIAGSSALVRIA